MSVPLPSVEDALAVIAIGGMSASQAVMLAGAIVGLTILMLSTRRKIRTRTQEPGSTVRQRYAELEGSRATLRHMEQAMLELDQLSREMHARLDTKYLKLEAVIRDADRRIEQLTRIADVAMGKPAVDVTLAQEDPRGYAPASESSGLHEQHAVVYRLAQSGLTPLEIATEIAKPVGEVELILALRKTRETAHDPTDPAEPVRITPSS